MDPAPELHLPRRYRVLRRLRPGGGVASDLGAVYLVEDELGGGHPLALECHVLPETDADPVGRATRIEALRRELGAIAGIRHPSLPAVLDFGFLDPGFPEEKGRPGAAWFFTREHVEGPDLLAWSAGREGDALEPVAGQVLELLHELHARGIVHSGIRPGGIVVEENGVGPRAKLLDLGAGRLGWKGNELASGGCLSYLAPEVLRGERPGPGADLFGLGVTLFQCLYRVLPYRGRTAPEIEREQARRFPSPPAAWKGGGWKVESIIWRLLARDPTRRAPRAPREGGASAGGGRFPGSAPPPGMERALGSIGERLEAGRTSASGIGLILIEGEAGSGKTRLLAEAADLARARGCPCVGLSVPACGFEAPRAGGLAAALRGGPGAAPGRNGGAERPAAQRLPTEDPLLRDRSPAGDAALWEILAEASRRDPVLITIDDLPDAPRPIIERLARLARRIAGSSGEEPVAGTGGGTRPRVLICATTGSARSLPGPIADLAAEGRCLRLGLEPLTQAQVRELLSRSFGPSPLMASAGEVLHGATGGNPRFIIECLRHLLAQGSLVSSPGRPLSARDPPAGWSLPPSVEDLLARRWSGLDRDEAGLAARISVARGPLTFAAARAVSPFPGPRTAEVLRGLAVKGVLAAVGGERPGRSFGFAHPRLAALAGASLPDGELRTASSRLARARRGEGAPAAELAFLHAGAGEDRAAVRLGLAGLIEAGDAGPPDRTARIARMLLSLMRRDDRRRKKVVLALVQALSAAGEHAGARRALETELRLECDARARSRLLSLLAAEDQSCGDRGAARSSAGEARRLAASVRGAWAEEVRALLALCRLEVEEGRLTAALELARSALTRLPAARAGGKERRLAESAVLSRIGSLSAASGDLPGAMDAYGRGLSLLDDEPDCLEKAALALNLANACSAAGQGTKALRHYRRARRAARASGARDLETLAHANLCIHHLHRWELERAEEALDAAARGSEALGTPRFRRFALLCRGALLVRRGRILEARRLLEAEMMAARSEGDPRMALGLGFQALKCRLEAGDLAGALRLAASLRREAAASGRGRALAESSLMLGVAWLHAGDPRRAMRHLERASKAASAGQPHIEGEVLFHQAIARLEGGDPASSERLFRKAGSVFARTGARLRAAECLEERGAVLREMGRTAEARREERKARRTLDAIAPGSRPLILWTQVLLARARGLTRSAPRDLSLVVDLARDLSEVLAQLRAEGARRLEGQVLQRLSEAHGILGNEDFARKLHEDARSALDSLGEGLPARLSSAPGRLPDPREIERLKEACRALEAENRKLRSQKEKVAAPAAPRKVEESARAGRHPEPEEAGFHGLVGSSPAMERMFRLIEAASRSDLPVVIWGETGTGKDLVARAIHLAGSRRGGPFVSESLGALPEALLESELFGHAEGAFTGAAGAKPGRLAMARGGSLTLSGVDEVRPEVQVKLLRALSSREVRPVGGQDPLPVDFRLLTILSSDPREAAESGRLRPDFLYRILGIEIHVPPLRDRRGDIPLLLAHFLELEKERFGRTPKVDPDAMEALLRHSWPGNVRELENDVRRLAILGPERIRASDLRTIRREPTGKIRAAPGAVVPGLSWAEARDAMDRAYFEDALDRCGGNLAEVARRLGIHERSVYKLRKRFRGEVGPFRNR